MTTTLTEFLLARIAEDEAVARAASWSDDRLLSWELSEVEYSLRVQTVSKQGTSPEYASHVAITCDREGLSDSVNTREVGEHIARHDPARVLAECEAKRAIVERAMAGMESQDPPRASSIFACGVLLLLAQPHAKHSDFNPSWGV